MSKGVERSLSRRTARAGLLPAVAAGLLPAVVAGLLLTGCGGGSGGAGGLLSGGQDPDPVVVDFAMAYVRRPLLTDDAGNLLTGDVRTPLTFRPGAELLIRDRASPSAAAVSITGGLFPDDEDGNPPRYDVRDLSVSYDGGQLLFALRAPEDPDLDEDEQPTWNIWRYERDSGALARVIESDIVAEDGDDIGPRFLPDGRILFTSTRQRQAKAVLLDEGKPQFSALDESRREPALALHVMNPDGSDLRQITFNPSSDFNPALFDDGRVVFSRWDNAGPRNRISLYRSNPDGTAHEVLYGIHSHDSGPDGQAVEFMEPQQLPDGRLLVMLRAPGAQARAGAIPVAIDVEAYIDDAQPVWARQGLPEGAQEVLISGDISLDEDRPALQGRYAKVTPLFDGTSRLLVAWSQCRLIDRVSDPDNPVYAPCRAEFLDDPDFVEADPLYGIWMHDLAAGTQQPVVVGTEGIAYSEVAVMEPRVSPPVILDRTPGVDLDPDHVAAGVGVLHIRSVYDFDGVAAEDLEAFADPLRTTAADRPARFLRLVKAVSMPDDDLVDLPGTAFGASQAQLMREVLGYAPIQPDGSVQVTVPANVAFWPEVLDANGRRIGARHQNWLQLRPGETRSCNGCHSAASELPHGRTDAEAPSANPGAPFDGVEFPNTAPALFANAGETMAEVYARIFGIPEPSVDIAYTDVWTDPGVRAPDPDFAYRYQDLQTPPPVDPGCVAFWTALCRITINYETHIHPLWGVNREVIDPDDGVTVLADHTCTGCHSDTDAMGAAMVPEAQLDLGDGASDLQADHFKSYRELLFADNRQILDGGVLIDELVQATDGMGNPRFLRDAGGALILDGNGQPIPLMVTIPVPAALSVAGANSSPRFFSRFAPGASHEGWLRPVELKLLSEWVDLGAQYYNNPFDVPQ